MPSIKSSKVTSLLLFFFPSTALRLFANSVADTVFRFFSCWICCHDSEQHTSSWNRSSRITSVDYFVFHSHLFSLIINFTFHKLHQLFSNPLVSSSFYFFCSIAQLLLQINQPPSISSVSNPTQPLLSSSLQPY